MYSEIAISKLSETQKSKLRNGHPVRVKIGSGNKLNLTNEQIKKLESAGRKGKAYTITLHPEQAEKHGSGMFGDIATKLKKLAVQNKDLINPIIGRVRGTAKKGVSKLANKANETIDKYIKDIDGGALYPAGNGGALFPAGSGIKKRGRPKGKGVIGDVLKNIINTTGLGVVIEPPLLQVAKKTKKPRKTKKGKGLGALAGFTAKAVAKTLAPVAIDAAANFARNKVSGLGVKKRGRPRKRAGGALMPTGY